MAKVVISITSAVLGIAMLLGPARAEPPATQPAAEVKPAKPVDMESVKATVDALGGQWESVHRAMDANDLTTAEQVTATMLTEKPLLIDQVRGTPLEALCTIGFTQLEAFDNALKAKDAEKAKTLMAGLDTMGEKLGQRLNQPTTQPGQ